MIDLEEEPAAKAVNLRTGAAEDGAAVVVSRGGSLLKRVNRS